MSDDKTAPDRDDAESARVRSGVHDRVASSPAGAQRAHSQPSRPVSWRPIIIGVIILIAVVAVVAILGYVSAGGKPATVPTPTPPATGPLVLPDSLGTYTRTSAKGGTPSTAADGSQTLSAAYEQGGQPQFVVLVQRPASDATQVMQELQAQNIRSVGAGACGRTREKQQQGCAVVNRGVAVLVVTQTDQTQDEMIQLASTVSDGIR